jgi:uncharacterized protein (DUF697 family)
MEPKSRRITNMTSGVTAVTAFITGPIPLLDEVVVIPMHYYFVLRMAKARGVSPLQLPWRNIQRVIWYGAGARFVGNVTLGLIPLTGSLVNSVTAIALTEYLGRYMDDILTRPMEPAPEITFAALRDLFNRAIQKAAEKGARPPGGADAKSGSAAAPSSAEGSTRTPPGDGT